jgi:hypothetical protein
VLGQKPLEHTSNVLSHVLQSLAVARGFTHSQYWAPHAHEPFSGVAGQPAGAEGPAAPQQPRQSETGALVCARHARSRCEHACECE